MVDVTPLIDPRHSVIQAYDDQGFTISNSNYEGAVCVFPTAVTKLEISDISGLTAEILDPVFSGKQIDLILIGTGGRNRPLPYESYALLQRYAGGIEAMDTGAAIRTYNVLLAEGRRLAAILL